MSISKKDLTVIFSSNQCLRQTRLDYPISHSRFIPQLHRIHQGILGSWRGRTHPGERGFPFHIKPVPAECNKSCRPGCLNTNVNMFFWNGNFLSSSIILEISIEFLDQSVWKAGVAVNLSVHRSSKDSISRTEWNQPQHLFSALDITCNIDWWVIIRLGPIG